ncbi:hypothetical protein [Micromonospora sp. C81]|uniref:hypothetical protein n=1 Tax=Micromonospora sp. C81 TaxID=2824881 RepID=UPI001B3838AE|nr:hypothetical protein [Micromonospora sp. C81]MBQ1034802.1 hypothetical protein [Micromonospora sp. C81]
MKRTRLWVGILGLVATSYLIFDPVQRIELAWGKLTEFGPYALIALAVVNLGRAATRSALVFIGPLTLAAIAAALVLRPGIRLSHLTNLSIAVAFLGAAALVVSASAEERSWARVMWTGRVAAPAALLGDLRAVAVLGEVRLDMLGSEPAGRPVLTAVTLGGRVVVDVPREWRILARPPARSLLIVRESGRRAVAGGGPDLEVRLLGLGGALELRRS